MATWFVKEVFLPLILCIMFNNYCLANLHEYTGNNDYFNMAQGKSFEFGNTVEDLPVHQQRRKRDVAEDPKCIGQNNILQDKEKTEGFHFENTLLNNTLQSLSMSWNGDTILAVTTEETWMSAEKSKIYLSIDGGKTFKLHQDEDLNKELTKRDNGLQKHPRNPRKVYILAYTTGDASILFTSTDAGVTFVKHTLPFNLKGNLMFHPENENMIMALAQQTLFITKDNAISWTAVKHKVLDAKWGPEDHSIYCTVSVNDDKFDIMAWFGLAEGSERSETQNQIPIGAGGTNDNDLEVSTDNGINWKKIHEHVYSFGVQGKFAYVSTYLSADDEEEDKRIMEVSTNKGQTWNAVQLPAIEPDRFFSILDMSYGMVFLHVDEPDNSGFGILYTSDSTGIVYSKSLERHLYPNYQDVTDFYRVQGMRGVYLASQMDSDNSVHTMISYNRGGEWKRIPRPAGLCVDESKECYLQIHGTFSRLSGVTANVPLSSDNAKGLILVHGHIASSLQTTKPDVFLSYNGGYDWKKVLDGPHHYQIADQGGLIVAVPMVRYPKVIKYSTDEGNCWHEYIFTDKNLTLTGLLTEPGNMKMGVSVWGYTEEKKWTIHTFNFSKIITEPCEAGSYVTWKPHEKNRQVGCFLGIQETFTKIKPDSLCHNKGPLDVHITSEQCLCTLEDYECDYGYYRPGNSERCVLDPMFKGDKLEICDRNHVEQFVTEGYHKIPGDKCNPTNSPFHQDEHHLIDMNKACKEGDTSLIDGQVKEQYLPKEETKKMRANTVVLIVALTTLLLIGVIVVAFFAHRNIYNRGGGYRYSMLRVSDYDRDVEEAVATHTSLYDDMSDEESRPITSTKKSPPQSAPQLQNGVLPRFDQVPSNRVHQTSGTSSTSRTSPHTSLQSGFPSFSSNKPATDERTKTGGSRDIGKVKSYHDDSDVDLLE